MANRCPEGVAVEGRQVLSGGQKNRDRDLYLGWILLIETLLRSSDIAVYVLLFGSAFAVPVILATAWAGSRTSTCAGL